MRIRSDVKLADQLQRERIRPTLPFFGFSVREMLDSVKRDHFPEITIPVQLWFVTRGPLACIVDHGPSAEIFVHQLLNHPDTPESVLRTIVIHELLHLRIPPIYEGETLRQHPQEFWEAERNLSSERRKSWSWIYHNLWDSLKIDKKREGVFVRRNWRSTWSLGYVSSYDAPGTTDLNIPSAEEACW